MSTIDVASNSALLKVVEKLSEQNNILSGGTTTIKGDGIFVRYSANANGDNFTESWSNGQDYIGVAIGQNAPEDATLYEWILFKGEKGDNAPYIGDNGNWFINNADTGVVANATVTGAEVVHATGDDKETVMSQASATNVIKNIIAGNSNKVEGLIWQLGGINSANGTQNTNTNRAKALNINSVDLIVETTEDVMCGAFYYAANGTYLTYKSSFSGIGHIKDGAPEEAVICSLMVKHTDNSTITDLDALVEKVSVRTYSDNHVIPLVFEVGGIIASTGAETTNNARLRTSYLSNFDAQVETESPMQHQVILFDENKSVLGSLGAWTNRTADLRGAYTNAAFYRIMMRNETDVVLINSPERRYSVYAKLRVFDELPFEIKKELGNSEYGVMSQAAVARALYMLW